MAKKTQEKKNVITGRNIYVDKHGRTVYFNKRKNQGFVIKEGTENLFRACSNRYLLGFIAIIFFELLVFNNLMISVPIGIVAIVFLEFRWHKLINSYTMIQNFEPDKHQSSFEYIIGLDKSSLFLRIGLYTALAVCLVLNIYTSPKIEDSIPLSVASYIMAALALYMAARLIYALSKKKK